jgi:hypothetical protein
MFDHTMLKEVKELLNDYTHLASVKKAEKEKNHRMFSELQWRENQAAETSAPAASSTPPTSSSQQQNGSLVQSKLSMAFFTPEVLLAKNAVKFINNHQWTRKQFLSKRSVTVSFCVVTFFLHS